MMKWRGAAGLDTFQHEIKSLEYIIHLPSARFAPSPQNWIPSAHAGVLNKCN